jgi:hypothetical protein
VADLGEHSQSVAEPDLKPKLPENRENQWPLRTGSPPLASVTCIFLRGDSYMKEAMWRRCCHPKPSAGVRHRCVLWF